MRVTDIPLTDIVKRYLHVDTIEREGKSNRYKVLCPFHEGDHSPSLVLYDNTEKGRGWDYHCFTCGAHGTAATMLFEMKLAPTEADAIKILKHDYNITPPEVMCIDLFAEYKGLDPEFLRNQGWIDVKDTIEIPFFDETSELLATKVRTKYEGKPKYYYKDAKTHSSQNTPYGLHWLSVCPDDRLYITEGETDCITLRQAGYPALGIMGSNGYSAAYKKYLEQFTTLIIVRDNDEAGWRLVSSIAVDFPDNLYMVTLPRGIKDVNDYHLYRCGASVDIFKASFDTLPVLPATPQSFVTAVQQKQVKATERECWAMVMRSITARPELSQYKEDFAAATKTKKSIINEALKYAMKDPTATSLKSRDTEFIEEGNCYYKTVYHGDTPCLERVTNFVMDPLYDIYSDGEVTRCVSLTNAYGRTVREVRFDADTLSSPVRFNAKCMSVGDFLFTGMPEDLWHLCSDIFRAPKRSINSPKRIGRLDNGCWLFSNCGVTPSGEVVPIGSDGFIVLDGVSYSPRSITVDEESCADLPTFKLHELGTITDARLLQIVRDFRATFGTYGAWQAIGWIVAGWFSHEVFDAFNYFPYLFVTGKRSSGKSVFCTMLCTAFGFNSGAAGMSIETPTNVGILRYLSYRSSLPQWYDDYRNDVKRITQRDGMLLDIYNRHGAAKGTRDAGVVRQEKINGYLLLSGEDTPANNALLSRCVVVSLSAYGRDPSKLLAAQEGLQALSSKGVDWVSKGSAGLIESITQSVEDIYNTCGDARYAGNNGIFLGAFRWALKDIMPKAEMAAYVDVITSGSIAETASINDEHPLAQFFNEFPSLYQKGHVIHGEDFRVLPDTKKVAIRLTACHNAWAGYHRGNPPLGHRTLSSYIQKEPFFLSITKERFDTVGSQRCLILKLPALTDEFPDFYNFCETLMEKPSY